MRIFELAKEIGQPSKVLIEALKKQGTPAKTPTSAIDETLANVLRKQFAPSGPEPIEAEKVSTPFPPEDEPLAPPPPSSEVAETPLPPHVEAPAERAERTTRKFGDGRPAVEALPLIKAKTGRELSAVLGGKPSVILIGADPAIRQHLHQSLEAVAMVLGEAPDHSSGHRLITTTDPDIIFIGLDQNPGQGLELIERLREEQIKSTLFVLSTEKNPDLILKAVRLGVRDFFVWPDDEAVIQRTILSLSAAPEDEAPRGKILSVFSLLGGCGATTLATNLAAFLAKSSEKQSILFDLDLYKGDVSFFLNLDSSFTITDFLQNLSRLDRDLLNASLAKHPSGLFILPSPTSYEEIEDITGEHVTRVLQTLLQYFDFIVVDCLKAINDISLAVMDLADTIILVTVQTVPALKTTKRCLELFEQLGYDRDKIKVVVNRFTKQKIFSVSSVEKTLDWPIAATLTNLEQKTTEAINTGQLLHETFPRVKLTQEIAALGGSLTGEVPRTSQLLGRFSFLRKGG